MKEDVQELPAVVPRKRRQVEQALDLHIAIWLDSEITPSERRRLLAEKQRRKNLTPDVVVGLVVADEGVTPIQLASLREELGRLEPTKIVHPGVASSKVHGACKAQGVPVEVYHDGDPISRAKEVVRAAEVLVAAPKEPTEPNEKTGVWSIIRYARNRSLRVRVILPDGQPQGEV